MTSSIFISYFKLIFLLVIDTTTTECCILGNFKIWVSICTLQNINTSCLVTDKHTDTIKHSQNMTHTHSAGNKKVHKLFI